MESEASKRGRTLFSAILGENKYEVVTLLRRSGGHREFQVCRRHSATVRGL